MHTCPSVTFAILAYNQLDSVRTIALDLLASVPDTCRVCIYDDHSDTPVLASGISTSSRLDVVRLPFNVGPGSVRNLAIRTAKTDGRSVVIKGRPSTQREKS